MRTILPLLLLASSAGAVELRIDPGGTGDALLVPHYSVLDGHSSLINLVNHRDETKAVAVRFAEAGRGMTALALNVYLAPHDSWSAALVADAGGGVRLVSSDSTCTAPAVPAAGLTFTIEGQDRYSRNSAVISQLPSAARNRTGTVHLIEMGVVGSPDALLVEQFRCVDLRSKLLATPESQLNTMLTAPSGGLSASAELVKADSGDLIAVPVTAITGFSAVARHVLPDPRFSEVNGVLTLRYHDISSPGPVSADEGYLVRTADHELYRFAADRGRDAISTLFLTGGLSGDFHRDPGLKATTEWVIALPTRHAYSSGSDAVPTPFYPDITLQPPFESDKEWCQALETDAVGVDGEAPPADVELTGPWYLDEYVELCSESEVLDFERRQCTVYGMDPGYVRDFCVDELDAGRVTARAFTSGFTASRFIATSRYVDGEWQAGKLRGEPVLGFRIHRYRTDGIGGQGADFSVAHPLERMPAAWFPDTP